MPESVRVLTRHAQTQFVLSLHARRDVHAPIRRPDDEVLTRRRIHVVHDIRKTGGDIGAEFFERIVDDAVGLPVRAPAAIVGMSVRAAVVGIRDAWQWRGLLHGLLRVQLPEVGGLDDMFERGAHVGRLIRPRCVRDACQQQGDAEREREAVGQGRRATIG